MAESTRVPAAEIERRESYIRAGLRPRELIDPFTWTYPWKGAGAMVGVALIGAHLHNMWNKKPWYFAAFPRLAMIAGVGALGYALGTLREHHYRTRDAVIEHYMQLHPEDFDHFKDRSGRAYSQVLLPWYPRRAQYTKYD